MTAGHVWPMRPRTVSVLCYIQLHEQLLDNSTPQHGVHFVRFVRFVCFVASCIQVWWFWWCSSLMKYCSAQILQQLQCTYYSHERMSTSLFSCNLRNDGKLLHVCTKLSGKKKKKQVAVFGIVQGFQDIQSQYPSQVTCTAYTISIEHDWVPGKPDPMINGSLWAQCSVGM